ncbi:MAG: hypothetical protein WC959_10660 [Kiritimatiellales bacterium]
MKKEIFIRKRVTTLDLRTAILNPRAGEIVRAREAREARRKRLIALMTGKPAREFLQCLIFGLAFWGAILAAAEFGMKGTEGLGEGTKAQRQKALGHDFHAPAKLPHQRASTLRSVFHTVPAPWRENAGLFLRSSSDSRASGNSAEREGVTVTRRWSRGAQIQQNSADILQNVPENGSGTVAQERRTISPREEQTNKNESTGSFYLIIGSARGARNLPVGGF